MSDTVLQRLAEFEPTDATWRVADTVLKVLPGTSALVPYPALPSVVAALGGSGAHLPGATRHLDDEAVQDVLWMSRVVDTGDKGYAIYTGVTSAVRAFWKRDTAELDVDEQQRTDAVLKAFALAYLAWKAFPGSLPERARTFQQAPAGRALLTWYAAVEVGLPFADNALLAGGNLLDDLMDRHGDSQLARLSKLAGDRDIGGVRRAFDALAGPIREAVARVEPHLDKVARAATEHVPGALSKGDKVAGALATAADVLPVYRLLGGRLAAEAAVVRGGLALS